MTTTAQDVARGALILLGVLDVGDAIPPEDSATGVTGFNDMVASWAAKDVYTGAPVVTENDPFPFEDKHIAGVKAMLAVWLAPEYGRSVSPEIDARAKDGWGAIKADFTVLQTLRMDNGLQVMPSQRRWEFSG